MTNLSQQTSLSPAEVMDRAHAFFVKKQGLTVVERIKHMHGKEGGIEISVAGATLTGGRVYDAQMVFTQLTDYTQSQYGLIPVYLLLHLHAAHKDDPGHLVIQANYGDRVDVLIETQEYEALAKKFIASLPL